MSDSKYLILHGKWEEKLSEIIDELKSVQNFHGTDEDWDVSLYKSIQMDLEYRRNRHRYDYVETSIGFYGEYDLVQSMGYKEYWIKHVDWEFPDDGFFERVTKEYNQSWIDIDKPEFSQVDGWWKH